MRIPDWMVYTVILAVILYVFFSSSDERDAPPTLPAQKAEIGPELPDISAFDQAIIVNVDAPQSGVGTAFAIGSQGLWLTARHVVNGCDEVGLNLGNGQLVPVRNFEVSLVGDLALLETGRAPEPHLLDLSAKLKIGQTGFHFGYPQGRPGEAASQLLSRSRLITRGDFATTSPILAWAEIGRTSNLSGSLGGMSGGPVFDDDGEVIGVTIAESARRGRIYTTAPSFMKEFIAERATQVDGRAVDEFDALNYGRQADKLRREMSIIQVVCRVRTG